MLKVQPHLERGYFFFADGYLILMNWFYVKYYSPVKIRCGMHNGINADYYLAIGAEKTSGIQLLFKSGERQVYDMLLSAFCDGKGEFIF